ncbi:MAG TPA: glycosyltransferase [Afifellaceae bacterium]|nr:glycosyltransferase [Afifellaceae bacterium]
MRIVLFCHSLASCWNQGNAHFLRGVAKALQARGHDVVACEPRNGWSRANLLADHGPQALAAFARAFPTLTPVLYAPDEPDLDALVEGADLVLVHEWNEPGLVNRLGRMRANGAPFLLLFHDTHHRAATRPEEMRRFDLSGYDGVLAFGEAVAAIYRRLGWGKRVWVWHEAADTDLFRPREAGGRDGDLVWVGNWGDEERTEELRTFLLEPVAALGLAAAVYGVRYPKEARRELARHGLAYRGWLANHLVPEAFSRHLFTVHVPRRPYAQALPGIPTIRVFEALACGIPLVSAPWEDSEELFPPGCYLTARDSTEMRRHMRDLFADEDLRAGLAEAGLGAIRSRHTCGHRADELLAIVASLRRDTVQFSCHPRAKRSGDPRAQAKGESAVAGSSALPRIKSGVAEDDNKKIAVNREAV